jgi:hypothetical protein
MIRSLPLLIMASLFGAAPAMAQTSTADGVQAVVRGDYQTAVRILRPLAENAAQPDLVAKFFLATLYESGHGIERNWMRACGLYLSAAKPANPFMDQSRALADTILEPLPPSARQFCSTDEWTPGPSATITIGPNHWVRFDQTGATVGYNGTEHLTRMQMGGPGWVFLPIRHTVLDVTRPSAARRHLLDMLIWRPTRSGPDTTWTLSSVFYEVSGPDLLPAGGEISLLTVTAAKPPSMDPEQLIRIGLDQYGEAEWALVMGDTTKRGLIQTKVAR